MAKNIAVEIDSQHVELIEEQLARGRFATPEEAVQAGLRLLKEEESRLEQLRNAIDEGDASGEPEDFDFDAYLAGKRAA